MFFQLPCIKPPELSEVEVFVYVLCMSFCRLIPRFAIPALLKLIDPLSSHNLAASLISWVPLAEQTSLETLENDVPLCRWVEVLPR